MIPSFRAMLIAFSVLTPTIGPAAAEVAIGTRIADSFARPAVDALAREAERLRDATAKLCAYPSDETLAAARTVFADTLAAWGRASVLRFGPLTADNRFERVFFFPDPRGVTLKQVQALLARPMARDAGFEGKSAAVQGLPALDFLLAGTGSDALSTTDGAGRCELLSGVAGNVRTLAAGMAAGWEPGRPFSDSLERPSAEKEPFRTETEVDGEIVKALSTSLRFILSAEINPAMGEDPARANGKRAPFWRSAASFPFINAQLSGVRDLLATAGLEQRLPEDRRHVVQSIRFELVNAIAALGRLGHDAERAFSEADDRATLNYVVLALSHAADMAADDLPAALDLSMGFNALDGD